jgi:hypothetical protein
LKLIGDRVTIFDTAAEIDKARILQYIGATDTSTEFGPLAFWIEKHQLNPAAFTADPCQCGIIQRLGNGDIGGLNPHRRGE